MALCNYNCVCVSVLALLLCAPGTQGSNMRAGAEMLKTYFAEQDRGGPAPAWRPQVKAVLSLMETVQSSKSKAADEPTNAMEKMRDPVQMVVDALQADLKAKAGEYTTTRNQLKELAGQCDTSFDNVLSARTVLKTASKTNQDARANATAALNTYETMDGKRCPGFLTDLNAHGLTACSAGICGPPTLPNVESFELTEAARKLQTCDFVAGETVELCMARILTEIDGTKEVMDQKWGVWKDAYTACVTIRENSCPACQIAQAASAAAALKVEVDKNDLGDSYCKVRGELSQRCVNTQNFEAMWTSEQEAEVIRKAEWKDIEMVICIFKKTFLGETTSDADYASLDSDHFVDSFNECKAQAVSMQSDEEYKQRIGGHIAKPEIKNGGFPDKCTASKLALDGFPGLVEEMILAKNPITTITSADGTLSPASVDPNAPCGEEDAVLEVPAVQV